MENVTVIDGGLRGEFRRRLRNGWHWQSIENLVGLGVPDSNYCCDGVEGWVEYKQTEGWACTLRKEQVGWISERIRRGGRVFIAVRRKHSGGPRKGLAVDELWIFKGEHASILKKEGIRSVDPVYYGQGGPANWDWERIETLMKETPA